MEILEHPNPALKQRAGEVDTKGDAQLKDLVDVMAKAMYDAPGVGLAAPQLGVLKRVIVYDVNDKLEVLCNPTIVFLSEETDVHEEACLSLPGLSVLVERPIAIVCEGVRPSGRKARIEADDLLARVLQHEIDHLDGVLIIDRASPEERKEALRAYMMERA